MSTAQCGPLCHVHPMQATCTACRTMVTPRCCSRALRPLCSCCSATCPGPTSGSGGDDAAAVCFMSVPCCPSGAALHVTEQVAAACCPGCPTITVRCSLIINTSTFPCLPLVLACRGTYYHRAWQAVVARTQGLQHVVQPNTFALQLPHEAAYSRHEASLAAFQAVSGGRTVWARCWVGRIRRWALVARTCMCSRQERPAVASCPDGCTTAALPPRPAGGACVPAAAAGGGSGRLPAAHLPPAGAVCSPPAASRQCGMT